MALMTWTIEVRVDFADKTKEELALRDIKTHCKEILATMRLLADKRPPDMALSTNDMFVGSKEIDLFEDDELVEGAPV